jgi:hypothetical protein
MTAWSLREHKSDHYPHFETSRWVTRINGHEYTLAVSLDKTTGFSRFSIWSRHAILRWGEFNSLNSHEDAVDAAMDFVDWLLMRGELRIFPSPEELKPRRLPDAIVAKLSALTGPRLLLRGYLRG